jgi:cytochrome P450
VAAALDGLPGGAFDLLADVAHLVPIAVMASLLDVGAEGADLFLRRTPALARLLDPDAGPDEIEHGLGAGAELSLHLLPIAADRRAHPGDDLLSRLADPGAGLELDEVVHQALLLLAAGHETTAHLLANSVLALLTHPDQLGLLTTAAVPWPAAVDELLRWDGPVQQVGRRATAATRLAGRDIEPDHTVVVAIGAANRDPAVWPDPDRLDLTRSGPPPLSFGTGLHHCVGRALATLEAETTLHALFDRHPGLALAAPPRRRPSTTFRALDGLLVHPS